MNSHNLYSDPHPITDAGGSIGGKYGVGLLGFDYSVREPFPGMGSYTYGENLTGRLSITVLGVTLRGTADVVHDDSMLAVDLGRFTIDVGFGFSDW